MDASGSADSAAIRFIEAAQDVVQTITAETGRHAQLAASELVSTIDGCQYSTETQVSALVELLKKTQTSLDSSRRLLVENKSEIDECLGAQSLTLSSAREVAGLAHDVLSKVSAINMVDERKARYTEEMDRRNKEFEDRLRKEHE
ncbi:hypothetical protein H4R26_005028, partial [Coemansia thaxteri]